MAYSRLASYVRALLPATICILRAHMMCTSGVSEQSGSRLTTSVVVRRCVGGQRHTEAPHSLTFDLLFQFCSSDFHPFFSLFFFCRQIRQDTLQRLNPTPYKVRLVRKSNRSV